MVSASLQVVDMVELFTGQKLSDKLKYEIARNSMMLTVFTLAYGMKDKKERENYLGMWAKRVSDFESIQSYRNYVELVEEQENFTLFEHHLDGLIIQYRRDLDSSDAKD